MAAQTDADALATPIADTLADSEALDVSGLQDSITAIQNGVAELQMMDNSRVELDYWTSNEATIDVSNGAFADFCVDAGKPIEFNLSATIVDGAQSTAFVVALLADGTVVAQNQEMNQS